MPTKLKDTLEKVRNLNNRSNSAILIEFYEYLRAVRTSERYQSDILKVIVKFLEFINDNLMNIQKKEQVAAFFNTKIKTGKMILMKGGLLHRMIYYGESSISLDGYTI